MSEALKKTIHVLASSKGKAARRVLNMAVNSSEPTASFLASRVVLEKNNPAGMLELIKKYRDLTEGQQNLWAANTEKLGPPIRTALLSEDSTTQENAIEAIKQLKPYCLIPLLLHHIEQGMAVNHLGVLQWAINFLTGCFSREFQGLNPRKPSYGYTLAEISDALEKAFSSWRRHERTIFIDVFFLLSERFAVMNDEFREMTSNPNHPAHAALTRKLVGSQEPHVMRFLIRSLDTETATNGLLIAAARRTDRVFIRLLLESVGYKPSVPMQENLARIRRFEWLDNLRSLLEEIEDGCQRFLVELIYYSGLSDREKTMACETLIRFGCSQGQLAVVERLRRISLTDGDRLVMLAAESQTPEVQVAALSQMRERKIKNSTTLLLRHIDSPHESVRKVIAAELTEFRLERFLQNFDALTEEQRKYMITIIKKIDLRMKDTIAQELENPQQEHKDFLLDYIADEKMIVSFESSLVKLVETEDDFFVRLKAVKLLALGIHETSYQFLKNVAENDANTEIRILAKRIYEIRDMIQKRNH